MNTDIKYGLLIARTVNLGDDIQALAARQFLPRVDVFLDRDNLRDVPDLPQGVIKAIINGWFTLHPENWPPSKSLFPLFVSFHITPKIANKLLVSKNIEYLKNYEPIGTRDVYTKNLLEEYGIDAYFTGCLTLTLDYKYGKLARKKANESRKILIIDLVEEAMEVLPRDILENAQILTQSVYPIRGRKFLRNPGVYYSWRFLRDVFKVNKILDSIRMYRASKLLPEERLKLAINRLTIIGTSHLVITSRLHVALPAVALGIPVIFVHNNLDDPRFTGLLQFFHNYSVQEFENVVDNINWEHPKSNPNPDRLKRLKKNLIKTILDFISAEI